MISPEDMRARWWLVPVLHGVAPWLLFAVTTLREGVSLALSTWEVAYLGLATLGCGMAGLLHAMALTRWDVRPPLGFSLLLGALAPFAAAAVVALVLVPRSLVLGQSALEPMRVLAAPLIVLVFSPIGYAAIVLWLGIGSWWLLRPALPYASATEPA